MKWLLTTDKDVDLAVLRQEVESVGGTLEQKEPVPVGEDEQVLHAEGPEDLHERLAKTPTPVKANPNSRMELY